MKNYKITEEQASLVMNVLLRYPAKEVIEVIDVLRFQLQEITGSDEPQN